MRIEKLALKGFLRFRDQVSIDLTAIPEGLVAVVGPNGAGKTTILEAAPAALYRSFMSRGDVLDYATGRDSFLDLQVAVDGHGTYRARVNCDGPKRASDAVLEAVLPNGSRRVLNDGKVSTFDQAVARVFPSKEVLLASAFASQNKAGTFISLDKKGRKQLFAQLLGIERYEAMAQTARQAATFCEQARVRLQAHRDALAGDVSDRVLSEVDRLAQALQVEGGQAELRQAQLRDEIARLEGRLATMADAVAAYASAAQRLTTLRLALGGRTQEREEVEAAGLRLCERTVEAQRARTAQRDEDLARHRAAVQAAADTLAAELAAAQRTADAAVADAEERIAGNQRVLGMAAEIRAAVARTAEIDAALPPLDTEAARIREQIDRGVQAHGDRERRLAGLNAEVQQLATAQRQVSLLQDVPCAGAGPYAGCQFLSMAKAAETELPALEQAVAVRPALEAERDALSAEVLQHRTAATETFRRAEALKQERAGLTALTKYAEALAAAEARLAELRRRLTDVADQRAADEAAARARHAARVTELASEHARISARAGEALAAIAARAQEEHEALQVRAEALDLAIRNLTAECTDVEADLQATADRNQAATEARASLLALRAEWDRLTGTLARVESGRQELDRRRAEITAKRQRMADLNRRLQRLDDELLDWQTLAKAFGATGLPVLEIDAAGPTISAYTNELLEVCFGPRFSVDLVTQVTKADGKGTKEDFSIRVLDNQRGGEARDIADLSGGEQVIVAEALSNAISIYVNTRSAMPVRTCWRDETTGALDPENATRYLAMLRKVQELGGFAHVLFISHNPDAAAQADAQIQLADGTATVVFPPFARVEAA